MNGGVPVANPNHDSTGHYVHESSYVDEGAMIGAGTKIWHFCHVMAGAVIGRNCTIGQNVTVHDGVVLGNNVKVQNNVSLYTGVIIHDDVFLGPSCVLTNVINPRSQVVRRGLYQRTEIHRGATIGANATIICGVALGRYAFVAAGAVVTKNVGDYVLVLGNPARQRGWMSRHGHPLTPDEYGNMTCPESKLRYQLDNATGRVRCIDCDEEQALPGHLSEGRLAYDSLRERTRD